MRVLLSVLVMLASCGPSELVEDNLVPNGNFEAGDGDLPDGWQLESGGVDDVVWTRDGVGRFVTFGGMALGTVMISSAVIPVSEGNAYTFSLRYNQPSGDGFSSGARLEARWLDESMREVGRSILEGTAVSGWTLLKHSVVVPEGTSYAVIVVGRAPRPTVVHVDDVRLYERR